MVANIAMVDTCHQCIGEPVITEVIVSLLLILLYGEARGQSIVLLGVILGCMLWMGVKGEESCEAHLTCQELQNSEATALDFGGEAEKATFHREFKFLASRLTPLRLLQGTGDGDQDVANMDKYKAQFAGDDRSSVADTDGNGGNDLQRIGDGPPSFGYMNLLPLPALVRKTEVPESFRCKKALAKYEAEVMIHIKAGTELLKSAKNAVAELHAARVDRQQEIAKQRSC